MAHEAHAVSRRALFRTTGALSLSSALGAVAGACGRSERASAENAAASPLKLPRLLASTERERDDVPETLSPGQRVGFAVVGLGRLSLEQILPAFAQSRLAKVVALVSGNADKARTVADRYGVSPKSIYDYKTFDRLRDDPAVDVVYVVLPNSMHAEYTVRAAQAGKHVLCEKPMANSVAECQQMIDACNSAKRRLMIAYRMQYEPYNLEVVRMARAGELGKLKAFTASNCQNQGDPEQWRMKRALAGGGALPDIGIYCLNAARYLTGEEPSQVQATQYSTPNDPRFKEVEEQVSFSLKFPSGVLASCVTSYGAHDAKSYRLLGESGWAELDPAFPYAGQALRVGRKRGSSEAEQVEQLRFEPKNQFALELDHMAKCVRQNIRPRTPGEEGQQDMRIIAAIYEAAASGNTVPLAPVSGLDAFRGPAPT